MDGKHTGAMDKDTDDLSGVASLAPPRPGLASKLLWEPPLLEPVEAVALGLGDRPPLLRPAATLRQVSQYLLRPAAGAATLLGKLTTLGLGDESILLSPAAGEATLLEKLSAPGLRDGFPVGTKAPWEPRPRLEFFGSVAGISPSS